ncbi:MAG: CARDB domain-containing protein, partial [Verrucomicrobiota bacterium]
AQGIRIAYQELSAISGRAREIRVFTDDQNAAWSHLEDIRQLAVDHPDIRLVPVIIGKKGENNLGIISLRASGSVPAAKMPTTFRVEVGNYGETAAEGVRLSLSVDGVPSAGEMLIPHISPGATQAMDLTVNFPTAGHHVVVATIPPDALTADNQRSVAVDVVSHMNTLIVEGGEAETKIDRDGYFLANALVPLPRDRMLQYYLGVTFSKPSGIDKTILAESEVVFLCNVAGFTAEIADALKAYVSGGGNLVVFPGARTEPDKWRAVPALSDLLPATMGTAQTPADGAKFIAWQSNELEHPVSALWNDPAQGSLGSVRAFQYFPLKLKAPEKGGGRPGVIVRFSNGEPAVAEWEFGKGRVVLFNGPATPDWNNLVLHPAFVPFMQRLLGYLHRKTESRLVLAPGESFHTTLPTEFRGKEFSVMEPDGTRRVAGRVEMEDDQGVIRFSSTQMAGAYRIFISPGEAPVAAFAVQIDPEESDLRQADPAKIENMVKPSAVGGAKSLTSQMVVTHEFWTAFIWVAAVLTLVEMTLAFRFSRAH